MTSIRRAHFRRGTDVIVPGVANATGIGWDTAKKNRARQDLTRAADATATRRQPQDLDQDGLAFPPQSCGFAQSKQAPQGLAVTESARHPSFAAAHTTSTSSETIGAPHERGGGGG
jgi:hypothetical protein